jgi:hypothetical protein
VTAGCSTDATSQGDNLSDSSPLKYPVNSPAFTQNCLQLIREYVHLKVDADRRNRLPSQGMAYDATDCQISHHYNRDLRFSSAS